MDEQFPNFTDKTVVFYVATPPGAPDWFSDGLVLESPSLQKQNDRLFVIGRTPQEAENVTESDWAANREAGIAWDSVYYYVVLPSDEYEEARIKDANEDAEGLAESHKEAPNSKSTGRNYLLSFSLIIIGILIPIALLVALFVWIVKML